MRVISPELLGAVRRRLTLTGSVGGWPHRAQQWRRGLSGASFSGLRPRASVFASRCGDPLFPHLSSRFLFCSSGQIALGRASA
uniref:Predicted protein n=1 Tax=Hordeum vulgare subsp. vulgare TaxID=112509 RepID=F2DCT6_HORVV|nr:predicted protein [Hordeum vulgare subsp. vulgare]BAJ93514.1 predicted protein [Hordeum vulgare subsp. vulgare]